MWKTLALEEVVVWDGWVDSKCCCCLPETVAYDCYVEGHDGRLSEGVLDVSGTLADKIL
jgi:hypothetical protein